MRHGPTGKISALSVDISVLEQRGHCWMGEPHLVVPFLGILASVPRVARSPCSAETHAATQAQEETEFIRLLWLEIVHGGYDDTIIDQEISKVGGCLIIDAKGVFDAIHRSESAALSMQDKRSAVEGLALRERRLEELEPC